MHKCVPGDTAEQVIQTFLSYILYEPLQLSLYSSHIKLFNVPGLKIPYEWLLPNERVYVNHLFENRFEHFKHKEFYTNGTFSLKYVNGTLPIQYRREMVRDFVWMALSAQKNGLSRGILVRVTQKMLLCDKCDRIVLEIHEALQGRFDVKQILCIYG